MKLVGAGICLDMTTVWLHITINGPHLEAFRNFGLKRTILNLCGVDGRFQSYFTL